MNTKTEHIANYRLLASWVIEKAVTDYKFLVKRGLVLDLKQIQRLGPNGKKVASWQITNSEIEQLLNFFNGGHCAELMHLALLDIEPAALLDGLRRMTPENVKICH